MSTSIIYPNVEIGKHAEIGEFVIIGEPSRGSKPGVVRTVIGDNAIIRSHTVIYAGNIIGDNFQTGHHVMVRESNVIGSRVSIGTSSIIEHHVRIGDGVRIHTQAFVPEETILEEGSWLGPHVVITNAKYPLSVGVKQALKGAHIKRGAKVGANATLLPGVIIGEHALVGAGSVVVHDVDAESVVVGCPARVINQIHKLPYEKDK